MAHLLSINIFAVFFIFVLLTKSSWKWVFAVFFLRKVRDSEAVSLVSGNVFAFFYLQRICVRGSAEGDNISVVTVRERMTRTGSGFLSCKEFVKLEWPKNPASMLLLFIIFLAKKSLWTWNGRFCFGQCLRRVLRSLQRGRERGGANLVSTNVFAVFFFFREVRESGLSCERKCLCCFFTCKEFVNVECLILGAPMLSEPLSSKGSSSLAKSSWVWSG